MRAFLGIPIPEELKPRMTYIQDRFETFDVKFVEKENLHFNLKFFEEISDEGVEELKKVLEDVCKQFSPFEIGIAGLGAFPNSDYIRVFWLGVKEGYQTIVSLAEMIDKSIESLGHSAEERFVPHLTLGRVRSSRNKTEMLTLMKQFKDVEIGKMKVDKIVLFQSKISPHGPVYEEVFRINLKSFS